ncbi:MAG: YjbE family putative metal transport protein [Beijerinckiaceae bacterium]|nr:YjbE family putative metal transport protein [Beijerinckiaceae bacterium]
MTGGLPDWLGKPAAVFMIDAMLAGDNALVIGLVCRALPPPSRRLVLLFGAVGAVLMRVVLAGIAGSVLALPGLKLAGGLFLAVLALNLARPAKDSGLVAAPIDPRGDIVAGIMMVMLFDVLMSLDNVLALAAVAGDNLLYLGLGLALSVSIVMFGSAYVSEALGRFPKLARLGAALLGWVAGQMVVSDAWIAGWVNSQAPALPLAIPVLAAAYIYVLAEAEATPETQAARVPRIQAPPTRIPPPRILPTQVASAPVSPAAPIDLKTARPEPENQERLVLIAFVAMTIFAGLFLGVFAYISSGVSGD